jgi:hypothetical protein
MALRDATVERAGTLRKSLVTILVLTLSLANVIPSQGSDQRRWSVDLEKYGYHRRQAGARDSYNSETEVAATKEVVALAIGNVAKGVQLDEQHKAWNSTQDVSLLFFDANNGKLRAKQGPWSSDSSFELSATSQGNFLLHVRHYHPSDEKRGETLYLLSPSGEEIKRRDLPPIAEDLRNSWYHVLNSPSRDTWLLKWFDGDVYRYELFGPDTLETKLEWTGSKGTPVVAALSDKELLGFTAPTKEQSGGPAKRKYDLFVRTLDGSWRPLQAAFDVGHWGFRRGGNLFAPNLTGFLSDHLLAGLVRQGEMESLMIVRTDGTVVFSHKIDNGGEMIVSPDGQYFGFVYASISSFSQWLERETDMQFWPHTTELAIWRVSNPAQVLKLSLGLNISDYSFSQDGSRFAYIHAATLKAIPLSFQP